MTPEEILEKALPHIANQLRTELIRTCPKDGGRLWITIKVTPYGKGLMIFMADYGRYVELGTPPHIIKVKDKKVLADKKKGIIFGKEVKHPGTRPNPFIRTAINTKLPKIIMDELDRASR